MMMSTGSGLGTGRLRAPCAGSQHASQAVRRTGRRRVACCAKKGSVNADTKNQGFMSQHDPSTAAGGMATATKQASMTALASICSVGLMLATPGCVSSEEASILRLPASADPGVFAVQRTMVEAWAIVRETFFDDQFNGHDWEQDLRSHLIAAFNTDSSDKAFAEVNSMLHDLGDPYTRVVPADEYASFRVSSDGELLGVGLLIANEPVDDHLLVLAPIKGGPAERAGILAGDEVLSINGTSTKGLTGQDAARLLRGNDGTEVRVKLQRRTEQIPGVPGRPEPVPKVATREVRLKRERVALTPIFYTALKADDDRHTTGYIRLTSFSSNAADEMRKAMVDLEAQGADSYILDLRSNPGGLVQAGLDVARLWLEGHPAIVNISGRSDMPLQQIVLDYGDAPITRDPLVVLVNEMSASASEILSGALQDNHRATVVGGTTYGKGKIQSVFELNDGSALFVTVAKYQTPLGRDIDRRGIRPDRSCALPVAPPLRGVASVGAGANGDSGEGAQFMPGLPVSASTGEALVQQLQDDACVLTAKSVLKRQADLVASATRRL